MADDTLVVNEMFPEEGLTFQGEGRNIGMPCVFIRLGGCNLSCSFCDTWYTWDWKRADPRKELHPMSVHDVLMWVLKKDANAVVISGGEPMLQQKALLKLTEQLRFWSIWTEIETAGTIKPFNWSLVDQFTVSPKLENSGNAKHKRYRPEVLGAYALSGKAVFKFVVTNEDDLNEVDEIVKANHIKKNDTYIMPEGIDAGVIKERMQKLSMMIVARGYRLSTRLHVELFGNKRGI